MYKIFVVEDDEVIAESIAMHLRNWNYQVECAVNFSDVMSEFGTFNPHLVLMDIKLPYYNGYYWCSRIREVSEVPIIFVSSASDNMNIVMAVNMGGDDLIAKPFDLEVLQVKVQAMLRRTYDFKESQSLLEHNGAILNLSDCTVTYEGRQLELTKNEFKILQMLMENSGRVVSRDDIMERLWENDSYVDENTLSVNVNRLRKNLESIELCNFITTRKGIGYQLVHKESK